MLAFLLNRRAMSDRRRRLFAVACCRRIWPLLTDERSRSAVEVAERWADGTASPAVVKKAQVGATAADRAAGGRARKMADDDMTGGWRAWVECAAAYAATRAVARSRGAAEEASMSAAEAARAAAGLAVVRAGEAGAKADRAGRTGEQEERKAQAAILRCLVGNPLRPARFDKSWRTSAVLDLARHIVTANRFDLMPVVADALEGVHPARRHPRSGVTRMDDHDRRVVWFPKDSWVHLLLMVPACAVGGVVWGLVMQAVMGGATEVWLFFGALWVVLFCPALVALMAHASREVTVRLPVDDPDDALGHIGEVLQRNRYRVGEDDPGRLIGTPRHPVGRRFVYLRFHAEASPDGVLLSGPAYLVKRVTKALTA
jgi:hypothetical protein